jgi:hypothetical protein
VAQTYTDTQAVTAVGQSDRHMAKLGCYSLELTVDLVGGHENKSRGEAYIDMKTAVDLEDVPIAAWVYVPEGAGGDSSTPNGVQLFVKDHNWRSEYGAWFDIPGNTNEWIELGLTPSRHPPPMGDMEEEFDPGNVVAVGVRIGTGSGSAATYSGPIYVDGVNWAFTPGLPSPDTTPASSSLDTMDSTLNWRMYSDDVGSLGTISSIPGMIGNAIEIAYDLMEWGWVGIAKNIDSETLSGARAIGFLYRGSGAPNTIELKLLYEPDSTGESAVFSVFWSRATVADDWARLEAPFSVFACWEDTPCRRGEGLDPSRVMVIDFAVSNKPGDVPGGGAIAIDQVQVIE